MTILRIYMNTERDNFQNPDGQLPRCPTPSGRPWMRASITRSVILRILRPNANSSKAIEKFNGQKDRTRKREEQIITHRYTDIKRDMHIQPGIVTDGWTDRGDAVEEGMQWKPRDKDITRHTRRSTRTDQSRQKLKKPKLPNQMLEIKT